MVLMVIINVVFSFFVFRVVLSAVYRLVKEIV